jgi:hypothetical protein
LTHRCGDLLGLCGWFVGEAQEPVEALRQPEEIGAVKEVELADLRCDLLDFLDRATTFPQRPDHLALLDGIDMSQPFDPS